MTLTVLEKTKIEQFKEDLQNNNIIEAIYVLPYKSVRGTDIIDVVAIVNDTPEYIENFGFHNIKVLDDYQNLENTLKRYKVNIGYKKTLSFRAVNSQNFNIDNNNMHNLKTIVSSQIIFDRFGRFTKLKDNIQEELQEYLNITSFDRKPLR